MKEEKHIVIVGGGAAGIFAAIQAKSCNPQAVVEVLERGKSPLAKVAITGGGRCNLTHAPSDLRSFCRHYPRGERELLGPFSCFGPQETMEWFTARGVGLKTEADGRVFPASDCSQSVIDALLQESRRLGVVLTPNCKLLPLLTKEESAFVLTEEGGKVRRADALLLATGSSKSGWEMARSLGHTIIEPVPSLFTFFSPSSSLLDLSGLSAESVEVKIPATPFSQRGPLLLTHVGFSGPVILKLSSWAARYLYQQAYQVEISINWLPDFSFEQVKSRLLQLREARSGQTLVNENPFRLPRKLWQRLLETLFSAQEAKELYSRDLSNKLIVSLCNKLLGDLYSITGKAANKEEFVACGGVERKQMQWKRMESLLHPGLHFAGEIVDIDALTGGYNLQAAWTTGYLAGRSMAKSI